MMTKIVASNEATTRQPSISPMARTPSNSTPQSAALAEEAELATAPDMKAAKEKIDPISSTNTRRAASNREEALIASPRRMNWSLSATSMS